MSCCCPTALSGGRSASSGPADAPGAPGWRIAAAINFAAQPSQNFADGPVTIANVTWEAANSGAAATWRNTLGAGLQFGAGGNTAFTVAGITATWIRVPWADLVPAYDPTRRYALQCRTTINNSNAASERFFMGVFQPLLTPTGSAISACATFVGHNGVAQMSGFYASNSAGTGTVDYPAADCLTWLGSPSSPSGASGLVGQSVAGAFCPNSDLRNVGWNQETGTPAAITGDCFTDPQCEVFFAFPTGNASATFAVEIAEMRVLVAA